MHQPKNIKARFRRAQAKKVTGVYAEAIDGKVKSPWLSLHIYSLHSIDFKSVMGSDPSNERARTALIEAIRLNDGRRPPENKPEDGGI